MGNRFRRWLNQPEGRSNNGSLPKTPRFLARFFILAFDTLGSGRKPGSSVLLGFQWDHPLVGRRTRQTTRKSAATCPECSQD